MAAVSLGVVSNVLHLAWLSPLHGNCSLPKSEKILGSRGLKWLGTAHLHHMKKATKKKVNTMFAPWECSLLVLFPDGKTKQTERLLLVPFFVCKSALSGALGLSPLTRAAGGGARSTLRVPPPALAPPEAPTQPLHHPLKSLKPLPTQTTHQKPQEVSGWGCAGIPFHPQSSAHLSVCLSV